MAEVEDHTLAWMRRVDSRLDGIEERLARIEDSMATKEQLALIWRSLELKMDLAQDETHA
jgi:hypothetical protein